MRVKDVLIQWKKESGCKRPLQFRHSYVNKSLIIFVSAPGYLIGKAGCLVDKYSKLLKQCNVESIEFIETDYDVIY